MTETLLHKLEEKMMSVLSEVEMLRREIRRLSEENKSMRIERENSKGKLENLVALMDTLTNVESLSIQATSVLGEQVLAQG